MAVVREEVSPTTEHEFAYLAYVAEQRKAKAQAAGESPSILGDIKKKLNTSVLQIEERDDLSEDEKASKIIHIFSAICAAAAVQPIPFADIWILTPLQVMMAERLAAIRGLKVGEAEAKRILAEIGKVVGLGMIAQQVALGLYKTGLPFLGGFTTIPLVYGLTYGIGRALDHNYQSLRKGKSASPDDLARIFRQSREQGQKEARKNQSEIKGMLSY